MFWPRLVVFHVPHRTTMLGFSFIGAPH
jgi:hypothetical protein